MKTRFYGAFGAIVSLVSLVVFGALPSLAQVTAFSYQGRLNDNGQPANGNYDFQFRLYNAPTGGAQVPVVSASLNLTVSNGLFTTSIDFGGNVFNGTVYYLKIAVQPHNGVSFSTLSPRQAILPVPGAIFAYNANNLLGTLSAAQLTGSIAPANIGAGTITSTMLATGSVTSVSLADGSVNLSKLNTTSSWGFSRTFLEPTPALGDDFGGSTEAFGADRVLIGAPWTSHSTNAEGAVYLFNVNGTLLTSFTNPTPGGQDLFGYAVAPVGDKVLVGCLGHAGTGAAFLFTTNGALLTTFTNPTPQAGDNFGNSVKGVGTDKVIIGSHYDSTGATQAGAAYLFSTNGTLLTTFTNPTPADNDQFGHAVAAVGTNLVLISSVLDDTVAANAGAVYLYNLNGTLLHTFPSPMPNALALFGYAIAAMGSDRLLITTPDGSGTSPNTSTAYLYNTNGTLLTTFTNPQPIGVNVFGTAVAPVGSDKVLIGADGENIGATNGGAAYLFSTNGTLLATFTKPVPVTGDQFGFTLTGVGTDKVLVGAYADGTSGYGAGGAAYLFSLSGPYISGLISQGVVDGSITSASLSNVAIDSSKIMDGTIASVDLADGAVTDAKISSVDAAKITTGILADQRLSLNIARLDANQTFTGQNIFNNSANSFGGDGSGLTGLNAANIASGGLSDARLSANVALSTQTNSFSLPVAIGTTAAPVAVLEIQGGADSNGNNDPHAMAFDWHNGGFRHWIRTRHSAAGSNAMDFYLNAGSLPGTSAAPGVGNTLTLTLEDGRVGIGTSHPTNTLQVIGSARATTFFGDGSGLTGVAVLTNGNFFTGQIRLDSSNGYSQSSQGNFGIDAPFVIGGRVTVLTNGNFGIGINAPTNKLHVIGGATFTSGNIGANQAVMWNPGSASWSFTSDRNTKERFAAIDRLEVLEKVCGLPIVEWSYIGYGQRHIGPMAQDFHSAFPLNPSDTSLNDADLHGVALAAIQGLNEKVEAGSQKSESRIQKLETENAELKARLESLERLIESKKNGGE